MACQMTRPVRCGRRALDSFVGFPTAFAQDPEPLAVWWHPGAATRTYTKETSTPTVPPHNQETVATSGSRVRAGTLVSTRLF
jgi:hypothetical protein